MAEGALGGWGDSRLPTQAVPAAHWLYGSTTVAIQARGGYFLEQPEHHVHSLAACRLQPLYLNCSCLRMTRTGATDGSSRGIISLQHTCAAQKLLCQAKACQMQQPLIAQNLVESTP